MSFRGIRQSKFRHVFGQPLKKEQCYDNIRITKSSWDLTFCSVNPKYVAIVTEAAGGGAFLVLPLEKTGRVDRDVALVVGHKGPVLDIQWCPHNDDLIASGSEDCTVKLWQIPEGGLLRNLEEPVADLVRHQRRVGLVVWHPTALNILLSGGSDNKIIIWNAAKEEALYEMELADIPLCACWNLDGSKFVVSCKDRKVRIIDPRKSAITSEACLHEGNKTTQVIFLKNGNIFSTGFSKMNERQYALWDENFKNLTTQDIDTSNGVIFPFYDPDTNMVYLCGKGDSMIRYVEITDDVPYVHFLNMYQSSDPQRGIGWMPKRGLNVNQCEIARFFKLHGKGLCEVIPMTVPRKSELFQDDLYPDTVGDIPSLTAEEWMNGENAKPVLISLKDGYKPVSRTASLNKVVKTTSFTTNKTVSQDESKHSNGTVNTFPVAAPRVPLGPATSNVSPSTSNGNAAVPLQQLPPGLDIQNLFEDIRKLKIIAKGHERRIKYLEEKLATYDDDEDSRDVND